MSPRIWRAIAIGIALMGFIDPGITRNRSTRPIVSVVAVDARDAATLSDVRRELRKDFTVVDGALPGAAASVIVGDRMPDSFEELARPAFAVTTDSATAALSITGVVAPRRAPLNSRVPISVEARVRRGRGDSVIVTLLSGEAVLDRVARPIGRDDESVSIPVWFVPSTEGPSHLHVHAALGRARPNADADIVVDVRQRRWPVLFFDRRPSWMSTFVRRAVERDPRFVVTSRVVTSRNVSTDAGQPPESFDPIAAGELFDAVVVGAPELLTERDVVALEAFMRRRGGGVVLLFDTRQDGRYEALTHVQRWSSAAGDSGIALIPSVAEASGLKASELAWPTELPAGAERVAGARAGRDSSQHAVIWRTAIGAGRLLVSGALDAWAFRDTASSKFDEFWRRAIAEAADATPPAMSVRVAQQVVAPAERIDIEVVVRASALSAVSSADSAPINAVIESPGEPARIRLWPTPTSGVYRGSARAPARSGVFRVIATAGPASGSSAFAVTTGAAHAHDIESDLLAIWIASHRGRVLTRESLPQLPGALRESVGAEPRAARWYPMRSAWWIVPFACALGAEWWWRRRRGLA